MRGFYLIISFFLKNGISGLINGYTIRRPQKPQTRQKRTRRFIAGTSAMRALSSAALVSRGPTEIFCLTELFII